VHIRLAVGAVEIIIIDDNDDDDDSTACTCNTKNKLGLL